MLGNLPEYLQMNFKELSKSLEESFSPVNQTELYRAQLREGRQTATEPIPQLGQDIKRLTRLAYPTAQGDVCETLAKEYFIDALPSFDMRLSIKQSRPVNLNDAIRHAVELHAFVGSECKRHEDSGLCCGTVSDSLMPDSKTESLEDAVKSIKEVLQSLQKDINNMKQQQKAQTSYGPRRNQEKNISSRNTMKCYKQRENG